MLACYSFLRLAGAWKGRTQVLTPWKRSGMYKILFNGGDQCWTHFYKLHTSCPGLFDKFKKLRNEIQKDSMGHFNRFASRDCGCKEWGRKKCCLLAVHSVRFTRLKCLDTSDPSKYFLKSISVKQILICVPFFWFLKLQFSLKVTQIKYKNKILQNNSHHNVLNEISSQ